MSRKPSKRERLVSELAAIQKVQQDKPSWFRPHDFYRLAREFDAKSAELVALEIETYNRRGRG